VTDKFKNKYRIPSARLKNWDYRNDGAYFITICTKDRTPFFGNVVDGKMQLSEIGKLAHQYWKEIPEHCPFVKLDAFVIMPNHMHGILMIKTLQGNISDAAGMDTDGADVDMDDATGVDAGVDAVKTLQCNVSIRQPHDASRMGQPHNANCTNNIMRNISPKPGSISTII